MGDGAYYATLTAPILESRKVSDGAKLFYANISRYTSSTGVCWASNQKLAEDLGIGERTISRYVAELAAAGFIHVEFVGVSGKKRRAERRIRVADPYPFKIAKSGDVKVAKNGEAKVAKNGKGKVAKNGERNKDEYINSEYIPPISPQGDGVGEETEKPEDRFERFWVFYRDVFCAVDHSRAGGKAKARKAWDKLKVTDDLARKIWLYLEAKMRTEMWKRGIGIQYASSFLNDIARGDIDLTPVQSSPPPPGTPPETDREEAFGQWH